MRSSYNFGDLISCLRVHMPQVLEECPPSNGGALLLAGNRVVGSGGVDVYFWIGEYDTVLIWFEISANIVLNSSENFFIFHQSLACWLQLRLWKYVLLAHFGILEFGAWRVVSQKYSNGYDLYIYSADGRQWTNNLVTSVCSAHDSGWGS